ncbi:OmpA family protein [Xanthomonas sp. CFBP 8703]|uniref:OmpA family protein n=1 Tax=Xanthomonas bonasiae TaxID=2810351 RepID=A0ABS3BCS7_9XANT|nr:OmpA family protein [Xanthomonas bonasiae]
MPSIRLTSIRILTVFAAALAASPVQSTSLDWRTIDFKQGHPLVGESLEQSLDNSARSQIENLRVNVSILKEYPAVPYDLMGRANKIECSPADCMALSGRRAQLVYDYLLEQGIPACQIKSVIAAGINSPVALPSEDASLDMSVDLLVTRGESC